MFMVQLWSMNQYQPLPNALLEGPRRVFSVCYERLNPLHGTGPSDWEISHLLISLDPALEKTDASARSSWGLGPRRR
jgi:hypothetical protein